jgi:predicted NBD/HSP70 family sugar kinase
VRVQRDVATTPLLRRLNAAAVLDALRSTTGAVTGSELMETTGLSRPTVHAVCAELIARGLVTETEGRAPQTAQPGRRPRQYLFNARAGNVIGIDLGARKVVVEVADLRGDTRAVEAHGFRHVHVRAAARLAGVRRTVAAALESAGVDAASVRAVTMGVPAPVGDDGRVAASNAYLPDLARHDLREALCSFGWSTHVENDANLAVIGERWRGVAQGCDNVVELLAGYRLGSGLYVDGRLLRGAAGGAGELAFLSMVAGVGNTDAIAELTERAGGEGATVEEVFDAVRSGDPEATAILDRVLDRIARVVAIFGTFLNTELVVISGGVAAAGDLLVPRLEARLPELSDSPPRVAASSLEDRAVVTGAIRVALDDIEASILDDGD